MQDFRNYSYTIRPDQLEKVAREAAAIGAGVYLIINGEYYEVTDDGKSDATKEGDRTQ